MENHPNCRTNQQGQAVLPNQLAWKEHLTLLLLSSKLLADTDALLKIQQDSSAQENQRRAMRMLLGGRKMPPIPYLLSNFITKKAVSAACLALHTWPLHSQLVLSNPPLPFSTLTYFYMP